MKEVVILFGKFNSLVGIVTEPDRKSDFKPAIIILNTGIVHRVGPNRYAVELARELAKKGHTVMRFDSSGIGDSKVRKDSLPFKKSAVEETREAMDYLQSNSNIDQFILMGICSGGIISFKTAYHDNRVISAILINTRMHLHGDNENIGNHLRDMMLSRHYWRIALFSSFSKKNWLKMLAGKINIKNIVNMMMINPVKQLSKRSKTRTVERRTEIGSELRKLNARGVRILHVYAEGDEGLDYMYAIFGKRLESLARNGILELEIVGGTNHTFTLLWSQERLFGVINDWLSSSCK